MPTLPNLIDGVGFKNMVDYAVRNLDKHRQVVNRLNVFPVPDGDTGTNMVTTIHRGLSAINESLIDLPSISQKFAHSVVFEARGNSGVIVSQFLKGISESFYDVDTIDGARLIEALEKGVQCAYAAVATPVEGTMLTVIKEATAAVKEEYHPDQSVNDIISSFVEHAKISLDNTPELLPVLKETGVVDSGGAGIVYLFEGMKKYLNGDDIEASDIIAEASHVDYDAFNRQSRFEFGYCTELLIQLLDSKDAFDYDEFKETLAALGDSLVTSFENDKVRIHIHTMTPETVFGACHRFGEFLSVKVENMSVQHSELSEKLLYSPSKETNAFAVVAVASDRTVQQLFADMGADVVIYTEDAVSTQDYIDAFNKAAAQRVLVFPNSSDAMLSAEQAKKLYQQSDVTILNSRSIADCYAALPAIDFSDNDIDRTIASVNEIIDNVYVASITKQQQSLRYGGTTIQKDAYCAFCGKEIITVHKTLHNTIVRTIEKTLNAYDKEIITVFHKPSISQQQIEAVVDAVRELGFCTEIFTVATESLPFEMSLSFE